MAVQKLRSRKERAADPQKVAENDQKPCHASCREWTVASMAKGSALTGIWLDARRASMGFAIVECTFAVNRTVIPLFMVSGTVND